MVQLTSPDPPNGGHHGVAQSYERGQPNAQAPFKPLLVLHEQCPSRQSESGEQQVQGLEKLVLP